MSFQQKPSILQGIQDAINQPDSVMEPTWEKLAKKTGRFLGLDQSDGIFDMMNPMSAGPTQLPLAGLISIFKNRAAREAGTEAFKEGLQKVASKNLQAAGEEFAARYPRVAAHMSPSQVPRVDMPLTHAQVQIPPAGGKITEPMPLQFTDFGVDRSANDLEFARDLMFHEGTHAAQALGNRHTAPLYSAANQAVGYADNPFEINANFTALRKTWPAESQHIPWNTPMQPVHEQLKRIAQTPTAPSPVEGIMERLRNTMGLPPGKQPFDPRRLINMILEHRGTIPPKPK